MEANNVAAMREALESIRNLAFEVQDMNGEGDAKTSLPPKWVIDVVNFALAAPARNCDKFVTQPEMSRAYEEYRKSTMENYGNGLTGRVPTVKQKPMTYDEWLISPETEQEGETDGSK